MPRFVTSADIRRFAGEFRDVCEGQPMENFPVLLREHLIQRCRVASIGHSTVKSAQLICREICMAMLAFQTPLIGLLGGKNMVEHLEHDETRKILVQCVGSLQNLEKSMLLVFNDHYDKIDWSYVDNMKQEEILLLGTADASEMISMIMALTFSECGRRKNTILYRGRRKTPKTKILFTPPLGPVDSPDSWRYNTDDTTHFWIGGSRQLVSIDGACFEYLPGRSNVYMWSGGENPDYEVTGSEKCDEQLCGKMLDRLKDMLSTVQFQIMDCWDISSSFDQDN